jgi:hypothetical protein
MHDLSGGGFERVFMAARAHFVRAAFGSLVEPDRFHHG